MTLDHAGIAKQYEQTAGLHLSYSEKERLKAALKTGYRLTPATLGHRISNGRWIAARHLMYISSIIAPLVARGGARIILTIPARHGKSELISVNTPIWFLERWPERTVITCSYGLDLATDFSARVRDAFTNEDLQHLLSTRLKKDKQRVDNFRTTKDGGLFAAGIGGPITGRGGHLILVDDYIKNAEAALSVGQREAVWEWFRSTLWTRLEPGGSMIILATRWHIKDLIGRVLEELPNENWLVINLPAIAKVGDPLGRAPGEALWPERYSTDVLWRIKEVVGSFWWAALYDQAPKASMTGLDLGDKIKIISAAEVPAMREMRWARAWDLAASDASGDWTAGPKIAVHRATGKVYVTDMRRFQKGPDSTRVEIKDVSELDGHGVPIYMEQEPGSSGKIVISDYEKLLKGYVFKGDRATGPHEIRAQPFLAACERGDVHMVQSDWNDKLKDEVNDFPEGDFDDQVMALALGYNKLAGGPARGVTWGRDIPKLTNVRRIGDSPEPVSQVTWGR